MRILDWLRGDDDEKDEKPKSQDDEWPEAEEEELPGDEDDPTTYPLW